MEKKQKRNSQSFINKLKEILFINDHSDCIELQNNGFKIIDFEIFQNQVLSKYFRKPNYTSFKRQLHIYGFTYRKNEKGDISFSNQNFNLQENQFVLERKPIYISKSFEEELHDFKTSLSLLQRNQQAMSHQINQILEMQKSVNAILQQSFLFYLSNKILANQRGSNMALFIERFYKNIKDQKYKRHLRKKYLKEVHETEYAYNQNYFYNNCFHPKFTIPKITIIFDLSQNNNGQPSIQSIENKEDDEDIISNLSNFFNL